MSEYLITVGEETYPVTTETARSLDLVALADGRYHLVHEGRATTVELLAFDLAAKSLTLRMDGRDHRITIADEYDRLVTSMGLSAVVEERLTSVRSPMPGLVLEVLVAPGDAVEKDDKLIVLEAMKMENILKAGGQGVVKSVEVERGAAVDKGQILIELE